MARRGRAKENPPALRRAEWHAHVRATPAGHIPVLVGATIPAWKIAWGRSLTDLRAYFAQAAPRRYWPVWLQASRSA